MAAKLEVGIEELAQRWMELDKASQSWYDDMISCHANNLATAEAENAYYDLCIACGAWTLTNALSEQNPTSIKKIKDLLADGNTQELERRLRHPIKFGTAGLRATMEAGFAGMNDLTVIQASQVRPVYFLNVDCAYGLRIIIMYREQRGYNGIP